MRGQRLAHFRRFARSDSTLGTRRCYFSRQHLQHTFYRSTWANGLGRRSKRRCSLARMVLHASRLSLDRAKRRCRHMRELVCLLSVTLRSSMEGRRSNFGWPTCKTFARLRGHKRFFSSMRSRHWPACVARASATAAGMHGVGPLTRTTRHHARDGYVSTRALGHLGSRRTMGSAQATMLINEAM